MSWETGRPILGRLPYKGYQDNPVADWATVFPDEKLVQTKALLEDFHLSLQPDTCPVDRLDYLGYLVGMSGPYWDIEWSSEVKRAMIRHAHGTLWPSKGTKVALNLILRIHNLPSELWTDGDLRLSFPLGGIMGKPKLRFYLRVPLEIPRGSRKWNEVERTRRNWAPAIVLSQVCYERFYLEFSQIGEPLFSS